MSVTHYYLPPQLDGRVIWINNLNNKLSSYVGSPLTVVIPGDISQLNTDAVFYTGLIQLLNNIRSYSKDLTAFKDLASFSPQVPLGNWPPVSIIQPGPPVLAGVFTRTFTLVRRIKGDATYTESIGKDLQIIGEEITAPDVLKPDLKAVLDVGRPHLTSHKHHTDGFDLYADYTESGNFIFVARVTVGRGFVDTHPLPAGVNSAVYNYQALHFLNDVQVGVPSDTVSITVTRII